MYVGWPDVAIVAILAIATIKGFAHGLVSELGGIVAVILALAVPFYYNSMLDTFFENTLKMSAGSAHVTGMIVTGLIVYCVIMLLAGMISHLTRLPVLGTGNALAGAVVGFAKGVIFLWIVLFVALLFPLSASVRKELRTSRLVAILTLENESADSVIYDRLPDVVKPLVKPILDQQKQV